MVIRQLIGKDSKNAIAKTTAFFWEGGKVKGFALSLELQFFPLILNAFLV
jgi:hypothetical protein